MANRTRQRWAAWLALVTLTACIKTSTKTQMIEITSNPPGAEVEFRPVGQSVQAGETPFVAKRQYEEVGEEGHIGPVTGVISALLAAGLGTAGAILISEGKKNSSSAQQAGGGIALGVAAGVILLLFTIGVGSPSAGSALPPPPDAMVFVRHRNGETREQTLPSAAFLVGEKPHLHFEFSSLVRAEQNGSPPFPAPMPRISPAPGQPATAGRVPILAVLNLQLSEGALKLDESAALTDVIRARLTRALKSSAKVLSREKVFEIMQSSGKTATQCTGECEVRTGREIGADFVVTGHVANVGNKIVLVLEVKRTRDGASVMAEDLMLGSAQQLMEQTGALADRLAADFTESLQKP